MAQAASKTCEICLSAPGNSYCCACEQLFCDSCKVQHKRSKLGRDHYFQDAFDVVEDFKLKCQAHKEEFLYQCIQCDVPVCGTCLADQHNAHRVYMLKDGIDKLMKVAGQKICLKVDEISKHESNISVIISNFDKDVEVALKAVTEEGRKMKEMIDKKVNDMVKDIKHKASKEKEKLVSLSLKIQALKTSTENLKQRLDLFKLNRPRGCLKNLKTLHDEIINQKTVKQTKDPVISFTPEILRIDDFTIPLGTLLFRGHEEIKKKTSKSRILNRLRPKQVKEQLGGLKELPGIRGKQMKPQPGGHTEKPEIKNRQLKKQVTTQPGGHEEKTGTQKKQLQKQMTPQPGSRVESYDGSATDEWSLYEDMYSYDGSATDEWSLYEDMYSSDGYYDENEPLSTE